MGANVQTIDEYLAALPDDQRTALEKLRQTIRSIAPEAEECISYRIPSFRLHGRMLVGFGAAKKHCSFFPLSSTTVAEFQEALRGYDTSTGTIRFAAEKPLPVALVRKLVKARIKENAEKGTNH